MKHLGSVLTTSHLILSPYLLLTMPPKSKRKDNTGATVSVSLIKRAKKATKHSQVPVTPIQDLDQTIEEDSPASGQDGVSQTLHTMTKMLVDLSNRVQGTEDQQKEKAASPTARPSNSHHNRRRAVRCQLSSTQEPDLSATVRLRVAKRLSTIAYHHSGHHR